MSALSILNLVTLGHLNVFTISKNAWFMWFMCTSSIIINTQDKKKKRINVSDNFHCKFLKGNI